jgi:hypothetical protein
MRLVLILSLAAVVSMQACAHKTGGPSGVRNHSDAHLGEATPFEGTLTKGDSDFWLRTNAEHGTFALIPANDQVAADLSSRETLSAVQLKGILSEDEKSITVQEVVAGETVRGIFLVVPKDHHGMEGIAFALKTESKTYNIEAGGILLNEKLAVISSSTPVQVRGYVSQDGETITVIDVEVLD